MTQHSAPPSSIMMSGPASTGSAGARFTPVDPIRLFKQYKWVLAATAVVGMVLGVGLYVILSKVAPRYSAVAIVSVSPEMTDPFALAIGGLGNDNTMEMFKATQALLLRSERTLRDTVNRPEVKSSNWYTEQDSDPQAAYEKLLSIVTVSPVRDTSVIQVSVSAPNANHAALLANAVVDTYIAQVQQLNRVGRNELEQTFNQRRNRLQEDIDTLELRRREIMDAAQLSSVQNNFNEVDTVFRDLVVEREQMQRDLAAAQANYENLLQTAQDQSAEFTAQEIAQIENGTTIRGIDNRILELRQQRRVALDRFGLDHRAIKEYDQRIQAAEVEKQAEQQRLLNQLQDVKISGAQSSVSSLQSGLTDMDTRLTEIREQRRQLNQRLAEYGEIKDNIERRQESLQRLEEFLLSMDLARDRPDSVRVQREMAATPPTDRSFPKIKTIVPVVTLLMLIAVGGAIFLREMLDQRIKSPSDARLLPACDLLGVIPHAEEDPSGDDRIERVTARRPGSLMAENFRQLRTEIVNRMQRRRFKTLMVAGCQPRSGTTAVSTNLAISAAYNNRRALIIDANFRQPAIHETFGLDETPGLGDILAAKANVDTAVRSTDVANLDVITIGQTDEHMLERIESDAFTQVLRTLEEKYDLIVVDAPPLSIVGDSRLLANRVDAVVLVVRAMQEKRGLVSRLMSQLSDARAEFLGVALNGVRSSAGGYFRRNYEAFYEYQNGNIGPAAKGRGRRIFGLSRQPSQTSP